MLWQWAQENSISENIEKKYLSIPLKERRLLAHYSFFLNHRSWINPNPNQGKFPQLPGEDGRILRESFHRMGGDPNEMDTSVIQTISMNWPPNRRHICEFYFNLIAYIDPLPDMPEMHLRFGYVVLDKASAKELSEIYRQMIWEELSEAPVNGSMVSLMDSKGFKEAPERLPICREFEGWMTKDPQFITPYGSSKIIYSPRTLTGRIYVIVLMDSTIALTGSN